MGRWTGAEMPITGRAFPHRTPRGSKEGVPMIRLGLRKRKVTSTRLIATAYYCTAWDGPGTGLTELRESCREFAEAHRMRISAWAVEVTPDDPNLRYTSLLRYATQGPE
jgi:hypothetical protein